LQALETENDALASERERLVKERQTLLYAVTKTQEAMNTQCSAFEESAKNLSMMN